MVWWRPVFGAQGHSLDKWRINYFDPRGEYSDRGTRGRTSVRGGALLPKRMLTSEQSCLQQLVSPPLCQHRGAWKILEL